MQVQAFPTVFVYSVAPLFGTLGHISLTMESESKAQNALVIERTQKLRHRWSVTMLSKSGHCNRRVLVLGGVLLSPNHHIPRLFYDPE